MQTIIKNQNWNSNTLNNNIKIYSNPSNSTLISNIYQNKRLNFNNDINQLTFNNKK